MNSLRPIAGLLLFLLTLASGSAGTITRFHTSLGDFDVELFDNDKPATVQNFLRYVQGGSYTNMFMHRAVPNFVIQGGGFNVLDRATTNATIAEVPTFAPVPNEFNAGKFYSNVYGTIAMAKTSNPDSATSQFFFNLADNSASLDDPNNSGGFTVFGKVIAGTNVLNHFQVGPGNRLMKKVDLSAVLGGTFSELPVLYSAVPANVAFDDLIYVNVSTPPQYTPLQATYNGLFAPPPSVAPGVSGFITVTTTAGPKFSGSLRLGAIRYAFRGSFDTNGYAAAKATSGAREPLMVNLHADPAMGTDKLVGTVGSGAWVAELAAGRTTQTADYLGKYTLTLPGSGQTGRPGGYGFAALTVNAAGKVTLKGSLADGTTLSQTVPLSRDGHFPLYAPLYAGGGFISGWLAFTNAPAGELNGSLLWLKQASTKGLFPNGFTFEVAAAGGRYTPPLPGTHVLALTNCMAFGGATLTLPFTNNLTLNTANKLLNTSTNKLTVSLALSTGLIKGSVTPPGSLRSLPFKGALWQKQNSGYGYFLDAGQSGWVLLQP